MYTNSSDFARIIKEVEKEKNQTPVFCLVTQTHNQMLAQDTIHGSLLKTIIRSAQCERKKYNIYGLLSRAIFAVFSSYSQLFLHVVNNNVRVLIVNVVIVNDGTSRLR